MDKMTLLVSTVASLAIGGVFWDLTRNAEVFGGCTPKTLSKEWSEATERRLDDMERQGSEQHVVVNPLTRRNFFRRVEMPEQRARQRGDVEDLSRLGTCPNLGSSFSDCSCLPPTP